MTLDTLLTIIVFLILGILLIKAARTILSLILLVVLLYFTYYTFFTYDGAVKLSILAQTKKLESYKIKDDLITKDGAVILEEPLKIDKYKVKEINCKTYKYVILCESKIEE